MKDAPDDTVRYQVDYCPDCDQDLSDVKPDEVIRKQIEDIPDLKSIVIEHQIEVKPAQDFMLIRSFTHTAIKQGVSPMEVLKQLFTPNTEEYLFFVCPD